MRQEIPFYSQAWPLDEWADLGFSDREEAAYWERSSCGILCLKMAIDALRLARHEPISPTIREYIRTGIALEAYTDTHGWDHEGLIRLANHHGVHATREKDVSIQKLIQWIREGHIPLISVKWGFETQKTFKEKVLFWKKYGGHIAVVAGYESEQHPQSIIVHHTSKRPEGNWIYRAIPLTQFEQAFTGRCILVRSSEQT